MDSQEARQRARKRAEAKLRFYIHLSIYVIVMTLLAVINLSTSTQHIWFQWPLLGWGIGVFFHAMAVFVLPGKSSVTERMIERELKKEASKS